MLDALSCKTVLNRRARLESTGSALPKIRYQSRTIELTPATLAIIEKVDGSKTLAEISQEIGRELVTTEDQAEEVADFFYMALTTSLFELR